MGEGNELTSYSISPKSCVTHAQLHKHIWWMPIKLFFGGCVDTTLHLIISEISTPGLNLVGKYSSELWASKQAHQVAKPPHMPKIRDYHSTLASSTLNILFQEILKFSKIFFSMKNKNKIEGK